MDHSTQPTLPVPGEPVPILPVPSERVPGLLVPTRSGGRLLLLGLLIAVCLGLSYALRDQLSLASLAGREAQLRQWQADAPVSVALIGLGVYVVITGLSLPGATVLTLLYGWYFGWLQGVILVSFASTAGATVAFLLSRFLLREAILARYGERLAAVNAALEREGPFSLFTLRLIPAVPFFVVNVAMGLTPIAMTTFWWVSQLGMLPATVVYVYAGASVPSLQTLAEKGVGAAFTPAQLSQIVVAFVALGLLPLVARGLLALAARWMSQRTP
jgi:uncharacterized membrane protein YdjX (TVP38/TMEM64 family)